MSATEHPRRWTIARHRLRVDIPATLFVWVLFTAGVAVVVGAISIPVTITVSGWEQAAQIARWYAAGVGFYLTYTHLPLYVAHGYTRREFSTQAPVVIAASTGVLALLMSVGYQLERLAYGVAGWPQGLTRSHLFESPDQFWLILVEFGLVFLIWTVAGALVGAGSYRNPGLGLLMFLIALIMVATVEYAVGEGILLMPFGFLRAALRPLSVVEAGSALDAAAITAGPLLVGLALTWATVRDVPLRPRPA